MAIGNNGVGSISLTQLRELLREIKSIFTNLIALRNNPNMHPQTFLQTLAAVREDLGSNILSHLRSDTREDSELSQIYQEGRDLDSDIAELQASVGQTPSPKLVLISPETQASASPPVSQPRLMSSYRPSADELDGWRDRISRILRSGRAPYPAIFNAIRDSCAERALGTFATIFGEPRVQYSNPFDLFYEPIDLIGMYEALNPLNQRDRFDRFDMSIFQSLNVDSVFLARMGNMFLGHFAVWFSDGTDWYQGVSGLNHPLIRLTENGRLTQQATDYFTNLSRGHLWGPRDYNIHLLAVSPGLTSIVAEDVANQRRQRPSSDEPPRDRR